MNYLEGYDEPGPAPEAACDGCGCVLSMPLDGVIMWPLLCRTCREEWEREDEPGVVERPINTKYDPKPISMRAFDWMAWRGDLDEGTTVGYGATKEAAIEDLKGWEELKA